MQKDEALVHLSRLALVGRRQDIQLYIRRMTRSKEFESIKDELTNLMHDLPNPSSPTRSKSFSGIPVDMDSRLQLLRFEPNPVTDYEPIWTSYIQESLDQIIRERNSLQELTKAGLSPTKSVLFLGKPGVGKTLAARWLANRLQLPLLILDLSAVMSSLLGRTGSNLRMVLDYAKSINCVLLLDEIDAIAKRRDDVSEIGELKRLVTVLLQEIDDWPSDNLMIAATNHSDLLDPAVWRRFETTIEFPIPGEVGVRSAVKEYLQLKASKDNDLLSEALSLVFLGKSFSEIEKECLRIRREAVLQQHKLEDGIHEYIKTSTISLPKDERQKLADKLLKLNYSQRKVSALVGVGRGTLRKLGGDGDAE
jgi:SpoVK/Ycf46/Vps4 family AAA+-type ATPase